MWIHFQLAKAKHSEVPVLFLELLRFQEMLLWITRVVQQDLGTEKTKDIPDETYQQLASKF